MPAREDLGEGMGTVGGPMGEEHRLLLSTVEQGDSGNKVVRAKDLLTWGGRDGRGQVAFRLGLKPCWVLAEAINWNGS